MNDDFQRLNADSTNTPLAFRSVAGRAKIKFILAKIDQNGNATIGITRTSTTKSGFSKELNDVKFTSSGGHDAWNALYYLNIWICNFTRLGLMDTHNFLMNLQQVRKQTG